MATSVATVTAEEFPNWLSGKLQELNTDDTIFGDYIQGILNGDESPEEKKEALQSILSEIIENESEIINICNEIFEKWQSLKPQESALPRMSTEDVDLKLVKLLESQSLATTKQKHYTEEEKKIRDAILSQYSQMSDEEEEGDEKQAVNGGVDSGLQKNLNAQTVAQAEKMKREQARIDSQKKKEKDKEDREKQKQLREEKKEKRKTVKGERRR